MNKKCIKLLARKMILAAPFLALALVSTVAARAQVGDPKQNPPDVDPQAFWSTPGDGRLVMLARNATDADPLASIAFKTPMPFRVRVCVTNFTGATMRLISTSGQQMTRSVGRPSRPNHKRVS
jgi:hypothetical protein